MNKLHFKLLYSFLLTFTLLINSSYAQDENKLFPLPINLQPETFLDSTQLDSFINASMNTNHLPGLAALIVRNNKFLWNGMYGYRDISQNLFVNDSTAFLLASVSKTITGTALMQLWEEGLFGLDENINNYLPSDLQVVNPNFPGQQITFRMLLSHMSSIDYDWTLLESLISWGHDSPVAIDSFLVDYFMPTGSYYSRGPFNNWAPGTQYEYSNEGYALAGYLVEAIAGTSFADYCKINIFDPLCMNNTGWFSTDIDTNNLAMPYDFSGGNYIPLGYYGNPAYPCGWLKSSAKDLANFLIAYLNMGHFAGNTVLDSTTIELINTIHVPALPYPPGHQRTLIWAKYRDQDMDIFYHGGSLYGCSTFISYHYENNGIGVILLINTRDWNNINPVIEIFRQLWQFGYIYKRIYAYNLNLNSHFIQRNTDTLIINTEISNPNNRNFVSHAIITSVDSTLIDSVQLYDDGNHFDGSSGDGIWGNYFPPLLTENEFLVGVSTVDLDSGDYLFLNDIKRFTTIGPVVVDSFYTSTGHTTLHAGDSIMVKLLLKNESQNYTVNSITADLATNSQCVKQIIMESPDYGNIAPGQIKETIGVYHIVMHDSCSNDSILKFDVSITSNDYTFWKDSVFFEFDPVSIIKNIKDITPLTFKLKQNYPNPFNPSTTIKYTIAKTEKVKIEIFNLLGQKIITLLSKQMPAGSHEVEFTAKDLPSGVYLYRIETGNYQQTRKMVYLK